MKTQLSFEIFDEYIKIRLSGGDPFNEIVELLTTIKKLLEEHNRKRILLDAVNLDVPSEIEKFQIGEMGTGMFGGSIKVAVFVKPKFINKFFENVVVNRGGRLYVAGSEQEALDWLLE